MPTTIPSPVKKTAQLRGLKQSYKIQQVLAKHPNYQLLLVKDNSQKYILKLAAQGSGNSKILEERDTLRRLLADPKLVDMASPYFPNLLDEVSQQEAPESEIKDKQIFYGKFSHNAKISGGTRQQGLLFEYIPNLYSLQTVKAAYPQGIPAKDIAWIMRRLLMALGFSSAAGVIHCAVSPQNVFIEPAEHGLILANWEQATTSGENFQGSSMMAPELAGQKEVGPGTDIYLAAECMDYLLAEQTPRQIRAFLKGCRQQALNSRPRDAWDLKDEFDVLIEDLWGKRTFHPFMMPNTTNERKEP